MKTCELNQKIKDVMLDTGKGLEPIQLLDPNGNVFDPVDVEYDPEAGTVYVKCEEAEG